MSKEKILVVEDDKDISRLLRYNLEKAGFSVSVADTGEDALALIKSRSFDLFILDVMLPGVDGLEVCRVIRQNLKTKNSPVMMLTAKGEEVDKVVGFELGADDYMVKPFSPRELVLRVKAILRRGKTAEEDKDVLESGPIVIDQPRHEVKVNGKLIDFTPMEFKLLTILMEREGRVQTREKLLDDVWGMNAVDVFTRTVDTHIKRLREKLGKSGKLIETVTGMGYRFKSGDDEN